MARTPVPTKPLAMIFRLLWRGPLFAIPFALFFGTLLGGGWTMFKSAYLISLVFAYTIGFTNWGVGAWFDARRMPGPLDAKGGLKSILIQGAAHMGASIAASFVAAAIIHWTFIPGFLGGPRQVVTLGMFSLLFSGLAMGLAFSFHFYNEALRRARSEEELMLARRIQRSFLLSSFPAASRVEVHALNLSSKQVSGDFYDVVHLPDGGLLLCVADVSGKGVPAALLGAMLQASLRTQAPLGASVGTMIRNVNTLLCASSPDGQFATMFLARLDEQALTLRYVNAGHNQPILLKKNGSTVLLDAGGPVVGIIDPLHYDEAVVQLEPGDRVVFYTDGVSEAMDAGREMFGDDRVQTLAASVDTALGAHDQIDAVLAGWRGFLAGEEPQDDVTIMILRVLDDADRVPVPVPLASLAAPHACGSVGVAAGEHVVISRRERKRLQPLGRVLVRITLRQFLFAIPFALFFGTLYGGTWGHYRSAYFISLVFAFTIGYALMALDRWILPHFERPNATGGCSVPIPTEIASYTITSVLASYLSAAIVHFTFLPQILDGPRAIVIFGMYALLFSATIGGIAYAMHFYRVSVDRAGAIERVRAELAQAEVRALRAQIHPHFLFNTLNSIASLIPVNPHAAEEMTTRLADVFRYALRASERDRAPLAQELEFLRAYLGIERARFGDRLTIEERVEPGVEAASVPTLLLQPLVENAVRHGIAPRPEGGTIRLVARAEKGSLVLEVQDDGVGFDTAAATTTAEGRLPGDDGGFGLHAVRERLRAEGLADAMSVESAPGRGTRVSITLPLTNQGERS